MTAPAIGQTSTQQVKPLISIDMFKTFARQGVDLNLVPRGTSADNEAALAQYIQDAADWSYGICLQTLNATLDTVLDTVYVNRLGYADVHPRYRPIIAVTAVSLGANVQQLQELASLAGVTPMPQEFRVPVGPVVPINSSQGPIQFGTVAAPMDQCMILYSYVNGYPVAGMTAPAAAGAVSIELDDTTGIVEGNTWLTVYAGRNRHRFLAGAVSNAVAGLGFGPGSVACSPLPFAVPTSDLYPTMVSALPGDAVQAQCLAVRSFIKARSGSNVTAATTTGAQMKKDPLGAGDDLAAAEQLLRRGGYVVPQE